MSQVYTSNSSVVETNEMLSKTYRFLGIHLGWASLMSIGSMALNIAINPIIFLVAYFAVLWLLHKYQNSGTGVMLSFVMTGLLGFMLGPILNHYVATGQGDLITTSLVGTALIFFGCATVGKNKEKDFSGIGAVAGIAMLITFVVSLINVFFLQMSILSVGISAIVMVLSSIIMTWQINDIVRGGERNYMMATITLFVGLFNIFTSLLQILGFMNDD